MDRHCKERIIVIMLVIASVDADCKEGQKQRIDHHGDKICCYPTVCAESQQFILCNVDDGFDTCKACPRGHYTKDTIQTKEWTEQIDICVKKPTCAEVDTIMLEGECVCNKFIGYFGHDINNCHLDTKNCKDSGHELNDDGFCVECLPEHFKLEEGAYGVCRRKKQCARHQVEVHPGSSKHDRKCRKRTSKDPPPPTPPPTTDQTDQGTNSTKLNGDGDGLSMMYIWLIGVTGSSLIILTGAAVLIYVFRKKWCCAAFLKMFKVGRRYAPVPPVETGSDRGRSTNRSSRDEDHELTSITNIDSSLDSSKSSSNSSKEQEQTCSKYRITEVIVEMDENETGVKTLALEPGEETIVKSLSDDLDGTNQAADPESTSLKARYDEKDHGKGQVKGSSDIETTGTKSLISGTPEKTLAAEGSDISIIKMKRNIQKESGNDSITKVKKNMSSDDKDLSITKVKRLNESENRSQKLTEGESKTPKSAHKSFLKKYRKGQSIDLHWPKFRKKTTDETSFSLPTTPKKSNMFGATSKESDRPTLKVEPFSRRSSPRNSQLECAGATAAPEDCFQSVPTGDSYPMFSDSMCMSHTLYSDSTGFYSCDDEVIFGEPSGAPQFPQRRSNRATLPPDVFVIEGDLANEGNKDGNGRVRSLPIISQEESESDSSSFWQQLVLHGLESTDRSPDEGHRSQDDGHNIIYPSVHLSLRQNAIPYTSQSNDDVNPSAGRMDISDDVLGASQAASTEPGHQISIDPLSTLDANSIMNEVQVSIPHTKPLISIPRPHEVLPPPEPTFDETIVAGPSSSSSEEAVSEGASSEGAASEGAASEGATSEGSGASVLMPLMEIREEGSTSTGSGSSRKRTLSRSLSMEEENKDSSSSTEKSMG